MTDIELRELECVLVLGEELHFGRTAERLRVSQGRVSQLVNTLERRIGGRLFERTSRRVRPTELGRTFLDRLRPAYDGVHDAVRSARDTARGVSGRLRLGFSGVFDEAVTDMVTTFEQRHTGAEVELAEFPLNDPFGPLRQGTVDAAILFGTVNEPDLVVGATFSAHPQAALLSTRHPLARRSSISIEDLAHVPMINYGGQAPAYWQESVTPTRTPSGHPIPRGPAITTMQEGITTVAANRGVLLFCLPTALRLRREDLAAVPIDDLPATARSLVWRHQSQTPLHTAFAEVVVAADGQRHDADARVREDRRDRLVSAVPA